MVHVDGLLAPAKRIVRGEVEAHGEQHDQHGGVWEGEGERLREKVSCSVYNRNCAIPQTRVLLNGERLQRKIGGELQYRMERRVAIWGSPPPPPPPPPPPSSSFQAEHLRAN